MNATLRAKLLTALTAYDQRESRKRFYNPYALPQYVGALQHVESLVDAGVALRRALTGCYTGRLLDVLLRAAGEPKSTREEQTGRITRLELEEVSE